MKSDKDCISRAYAIEQIKKARAEGKSFNYDTLIDFIKILPSVKEEKQ